MDIKPTPLSGWVDILLEAFIPVVLAIFGNLVNLLNTKKPYFSFQLWLSGIATSILVGLIIAFSCINMGFNNYVTAISSSIGGYCARDFLLIIKKSFLSKVEKL